MATFTISLSGSGIVNGSKSWTVSDPDVQSLIDYMTEKYTPRGQAALTPQQALLAWAQGFVSDTVNEVRTATRKAQIDALVVPTLGFS